MPWPSKITGAFSTFGQGADMFVRLNRYHGPYNKLLCTLFLPDSDFTVAPIFIRDNHDDGADFVIFSKSPFVTTPC